ncbi:MarR family winged helix-turn-helix transcriptional regulator [Antrihabitans sp. YC2-6]|uniref:MarR family winged helix-turn-helix transcriptional regulator n=1 Tax=Antrihabitans sp. YC2-6 TaxID=2799498 RepID=UPI0018F44BB7|nr:MarR family transcriptional regulator [Antrihabitans sp. YC2-6]MBJ8345547.1 MarR family transcriptional regulator [Antrihabitans sp. YC2-6]
MADEVSLSESFWGVTRRLRARWRESLAPWDVSPSHSRALGVLMQHGTMRLSELTEHLRIAARSTTEVVDALAARGLVERRDDPSDRRATLVALTNEGARVGKAIAHARDETTAAFFDVLSETDRKHLERILRKLRAT